MKCMINLRGKIIPEEKNTLEAKDWVGEEEEFEWEVFGRGEELETIKRDWEKWETNSTEAIYRKPRFSMDRKVSRGIEL